MDKTGYKQATIAYKVTRSGGKPLDVEGNLTSVSGKKQAIALLTGKETPDPQRYEVEFYFNEREEVSGNPTVTYDVRECVIGYIWLNPAEIIMHTLGSTASFTLESSSPWRLYEGPSDIVTFDRTKGSAGTFLITVSGTNKQGWGYFIFRNDATGQTAQMLITNGMGKPWILENGKWNSNAFWFNNGIWRFN